MKQNDYTGLTDAQVLESRKKHGENILTPPEKDSLWKRFFEKLTGPFGHHIKGWEDGDELIFILEIAALLSILISFSEYYGWLGAPSPDGWKVFFEPVGILIAIMLATGIAFHYELKADKEFSLLNQVNDDEQVEVMRNGIITTIPKKEVVVGDIVIVNTGAEIPADGDLIEAISLNIDESSLTGEPVCRKSVKEEEFDKNATYATNHVLRGTKVMEGHGVFCVTEVGDKTEYGKVAEDVQIDDSVKTPLNEQLDGLGEKITTASYWIAALIIVGRIIMYFVYPAEGGFNTVHFISYILQTFMIAVTLVVVAVPEGLPMAVSLSLAYSMRDMLRNNNLVRKMHACETMGATTVICTDKTGTLTQNQMQVYETKFYNLKDQNLGDDDESKIIAEGIAVNSTAELDFSDVNSPEVLGNPTEGALLLWLNKNKKNYLKLRKDAEILEELPFSTERKYMATVVKSAQIPGKTILYVKGAPEIVYAMCKGSEGNITKEEISDQLLKYQNQAMRTLGFAYQILDNEKNIIVDGKVEAKDLVFIGITAISDPVRKDVPDAVKQCLKAGIDVKIVTGDTPSTAKQIGREIGIWTDKDTDNNIITGPEFAALSDEELYERVLDLKIISRARPLDKKRLVQALQHKNQVVAVTGDGTNDAPALKAAHVGLSMGDGTSVAKEASDITILDNSFSSIGVAVKWGRSLYRNIQRFLLFQLTVNVSACFIVLVGAFLGTQSPLTVTQMLWVNLIMDTFAAVALASLPPSDRVMNEKPRNRGEKGQSFKESIKNKSFILDHSMMNNIFGVGGIFFLILLVLLVIFENAKITQMSDILNIANLWGTGKGVDGYELSLFFTVFVMTHFFYLFNAKAYMTGRSAFSKLGECKGLMLIATIILLGQIAMVQLPGIQEFFNIEEGGLKSIDWIVIIIGSSFVLWIREIWRIFK